MRWLLLVLTLFSYAICFTRHSPGAMAFWLLVSVVTAIVATLAFAQFRIAGSARSDELSEYELRQLREGKDPLRPGGNS